MNTRFLNAKDRLTRTAWWLALLSLAVATGARAANSAWSTAPASSKFADNNWTSGTTPGAASSTPSSGDSLYFGTSSILALTNNDSGFTFAGLTFNSGASAFTMNGNAFALATGSGVTNNSAATQSITNVISGAGNVVQAGAGTLILSGANTYSAGTVVSAGTLVANVAGALGTNGATTVNGILDLNAGPVTYTGLTNGMTGSGTVNIVLGTGTATTTMNANNSGFNGTINLGTNGLTGAVAASGAGKVQMLGLLGGSAVVNALSNSTLIVNGVITNPAALYLYGGDTGESIGQLRIESGGVWAGPVTLAGPITGSGDGHIGANSGSMGTIAGNISQIGGAQSLVKVGGGTNLLAGTNTYTSYTTNLAGTLKFGSTGVLGDGVNNTAGLVLTGGAVDFAGFSPTAIVPLFLNSTANGNDVGSIDSTTAGVVKYGGTVAIGAATLVIGTGNFLFTNTVTGNGKNVNKNGTGNVELTNSGAITLGTLQVNRGGVVVDAGTTLNVTSLNIGSGGSVGGGLTLNGGGVNCSGNSAFGTGSGGASGSLTLNSGTLTVTNLAKGAVTFNINFNGGILKAGASNPFFLTNVSSAKVQAGNAYIDDGGYNIAIAAPLVADTVSGGLVKLGSGTLTLSNLNTYTAGTTVSNGTLVLAAGGATGAIRNNLTIQPGAVVALTAGDALGYVTCVTNVNIYGGLLTNAGAGLFESYSTYYNLSGGTVASAGGPFTFTGQGIASLSNSVLSVFNAPVRLVANGTLTLGAAAGTVPGGVDLSILGNIYQSGGVSGVTKTGAGVVQLNGVNTHGGSTIINVGTLALGATATIPNTTNISVAAGATFDVSAVSPFALGSSQALGGSGTVNGSVTDSGGSQFNPGGINTIGTLTITPDLTLAGGDTLNFDFSAGGSNDVLNIGGTLTPNGTTTINLANWPIGGFLQTNYVLIQAASLGGSVGSFTLANVPTGGRQTYDIVYDTSGSPQKVLLQVSGFNANLVWQGGSGNLWDVFSTQDWLNGGSPDYFFTSDNVLFSNVPPANAAVNITPISIAPGLVAINSTNNYVFTGGYITGSAALVKNGSGSVTLAAANDYTGGTTVNGGTLQLGDGSANNGSVAGAIANNAALVVSNASSQTLNNNLSGSGKIIASGAADLTLSGNIGGTQQVVGNDSGGLILSGTNSYTGGTVVSNGVLIAAKATALGAPSSGILATVGSGATLAYEVAGTQTLTNPIVGAGALAYSNAAPGSLGNGVVGLKLAVSNSFSGGLTINVGSVYAYNNNALSTGPVTIDNGGQGGAYYNQLFVGNGQNIRNAVTIVNASSYYDGVLMVDPGPNNSYGASDTNGGTFSGPITVAVGANIQRGALFCGPGNGTNYLFITGPVTNNNVNGDVDIHNGRVRLSGGGSYSKFSVSNAGLAQNGANNGIATNAALLISGGSFDLNGYNQTFAGLSSSGGGSVKNSSANASTLTLDLLSDNTYGNVISGKVNLVLDGSFTLNLTGTNTYTGNTTVNGGKLELAVATLATNSTVTVASGAVLQLDFAVTNQVGSLVLGGASQSPGVYDSSIPGGFITGTGSLQILSTVATYSTNITATVSGSSLIVSWPATHLGWSLQAQTNSLAAGLGTNWVDVTGSASVNSVTNTMDAASGAVFYRLKY